MPFANCHRCGRLFHFLDPTRPVDGWKLQSIEVLRVSLQTALIFQTWIALHIAMACYGLLWLCGVTFSVTSIALNFKSTKRRVIKTIGWASIPSVVVTAILAGYYSQFSGPLPPDTPFFNKWRIEQTVYESLDGAVTGMLLSLGSLLIIGTPLVLNSLVRDRWDRYYIEDEP